MPVQIGAKTHNFDDPTGLLSDCHRRIEMFLGTLQAVATVIDHPPTEETRSGLATALQYFSEAAPKHTADEKQSLFPRLRQMHYAEIRSCFSDLENLEEEHRWAASLHAEIYRLGKRYLSIDSLSPAEIETFRAAIASLASMYKQHISIEDSVLFPLATRLLSPADKMDMAKEMATRRNVKLVTGFA